MAYKPSKGKTMKLSHRCLLFMFTVGIFASISQSATIDPKAAAAKIGSTKITNKEIDDFAKVELKKLNEQHQEQMYQIRRQALNSIVEKRILEAKAKASGKSADDFLKSELLDKITNPTDVEIQTVYDDAKASGRQLPPFAELKEQITAYLKQQKSQTATQAFYDKLKSEAKVEIFLKPYQPSRVNVEAKGPSRGPDKAPITIVEFSDFECPFCSKGEEVISEVMAAYKDKIKIVFRDFPLPMHSHAPKAAEAAHCANDQGKYWEMHAKLFANQKSLEVASLKEYAKVLNLDLDKFSKCLDSGEKAKLVEENQKVGTDLGITGTPAFFVNGILISGAQPMQAFKDIIDVELAKK